MTAQLNAQFTDPPAPGDPSQAAALFAVHVAFDEWTRHFDDTAGAFTINVAFRAPVPSADVVVGLPDFTRVGFDARTAASVIEPSFGLAFAARAAPSTNAPTLTLFIDPAKFNGSAVNSNITASIERELGHALGIARYSTGSLLTSILSRPPSVLATVYDTGVRTVQGPPNYVTTFNGPNAEAAYGGPVPVDVSNTNVTTVGGGLAADTTTQAARTVQPLDVALLRDAGLPALSDREVQEHRIARLYFGAFGRTADSGGLLQEFSVLRASPSALGQVGDDLVSSPEFAARYGTLSNADFVRTVYQNALGRQPDAAQLNLYLSDLTLPGRYTASRGDVLASITESDEARGRLSANPNVTYAATAEAQVARAYDTAFGRDADPAGFTLVTAALVNGTTLRQVALSFLASAEFANRYGIAPTDRQLVDQFYQNTLHRAPDAAGEALYVQALASGQFGRADLLTAFSDSTEHINLVAQAAGARDAAGYNLDLTPHLGIIPVIGAPS